MDGSQYMKFARKSTGRELALKEALPRSQNEEQRKYRVALDKIHSRLGARPLTSTAFDAVNEPVFSIFPASDREFFGARDGSNQ